MCYHTQGGSVSREILRTWFLQNFADSSSLFDFFYSQRFWLKKTWWYRICLFFADGYERVYFIHPRCTTGRIILSVHQLGALLITYKRNLVCCSNITKWHDNPVVRILLSNWEVPTILNNPMQPWSPLKPSKQFSLVNWFNLSCNIFRLAASHFVNMLYPQSLTAPCIGLSLPFHIPVLTLQPEGPQFQPVMLRMLSPWNRHPLPPDPLWCEYPHHVYPGRSLKIAQFPY